MGEFDGKVAIVTGGTRGIGKSVAQQFADKGARVAVVGTNAEKAKEVAEAIGPGVIGLGADVSVYADCVAMVENTIATFGRLDVLVNNAGVSGVRAHVGELPVEDWLHVININLNGVFYCSKAAIPEMQKSGGGSIVNMASVEGLMGLSSLSAYVSAKHAVIGFTKNVALEYGSQNIRCNSVAPGFVATEMTGEGFSDEERAAITTMTAMGRPATPAEVANLVCWLASDSAAYITGSCQLIDGGLMAGVNF